MGELAELDVRVYDVFRRFVFREYRRRFRVTLVFSEDNLRRVYEFYKFAVGRGLGLVAGVEEFFGYRYRRFENFVRECGVWRGGWVMFRFAVLMGGETESGGGVRFTLGVGGFEFGVFSLGRVNMGVLRFVLDEVGYSWLEGVPHAVGLEVYDEYRWGRFDCRREYGFSLIVVKGFGGKTVKGRVVVGAYDLFSLYLCEEEWRVFVE